MITTKLSGILTDVFPVETNDRFTKKVFWLKEPDTERYPQHWELELQGGDVDRLKGIHEGDRLTCEVEIRGRKYKTRDGQFRIFTTLKCIGILVAEKLDAPGFKPIKKPGREMGEDRPNEQPELPL